MLSCRGLGGGGEEGPRGGGALPARARGGGPLPPPPRGRRRGSSGGVPPAAAAARRGGKTKASMPSPQGGWRRAAHVAGRVGGGGSEGMRGGWGEGGRVEPLCCVRTTPLESLQEHKAKTSRSPPFTTDHTHKTKPHPQSNPLTPTLQSLSSIVMLESEALGSATRHAAPHTMPPALPPGMPPDMSPSMEHSPPAMPPGTPLGTSPGMRPGMSPTRQPPND